jgi:hypothetical protein
LYQSITDSELLLQVSLDGGPLEQVSLLSPSQVQPNGNTVSLDYIPSRGWRSGTYTFQAHLYGGGKLLKSTNEEELQVTPESATKVVSWATLGMIIGAALILIVAMVVVVLYHRRDMLRGHID